MSLAAVGAGLGLANSLFGGGDSGGQQVSKDPWGPAQKPLQNTLDYAQMLQGYQMQNPWNPMQQTAYQNTFTDLDAFRAQNNGLMNYANQLMGTNYQRGQSSRPAGLLAMQPQQQMPGQMMARPQGLLGHGVFSIPQGQRYGQMNWQEMNPWTATGGPRVDEPKEETDEERRRREEEERNRNWVNPDRHGAGA
jgi:hypothetical protein